MWTDYPETAFTNLKSQLTKAPVLVFPDFSKYFRLDTDSSFDRIGAALAQKNDEGRERVMAYGSKSINKHIVLPGKNY